MGKDTETSVGKGPDSASKKKRSPADYSLGEAIDLLTEKEWRLLTDLYMCRCMPQSVVIDTYFIDNPEYQFTSADASIENKSENENKNRDRAIVSTRRALKKLKDRGIVEASSGAPGETWYYLTGRGLRVIEMKRGILEENRLSKNELDMERAKKDHFWELGKVYLDLRYNWMDQSSELKQFFDWDWYPSMSVHSDNDINFVRPDAILRIGQQIFYIELDRSTEPVQRSPFYTDQVSIEKKLERYRDIIKLSTNLIIRNGIIAFIVPDAVYKTRLNNIAMAAERVFSKDNRVFTGRTIGDIISAYPNLDGSK